MLRRTNLVGFCAWVFLLGACEPPSTPATQASQAPASPPPSSSIDTPETHAADEQASAVFPEEGIAHRVHGVRRYNSSFLSYASPNFREPVTDEAAWSRLGQDLCGGLDIHSYIVSASYWPGAGTTVGKALKDRERTRAALACGKAAAQAMGPHIYRIHPAPSRANVMALDIGGAGLPPGGVPLLPGQLRAFLDGRCFPAQGQLECNEKARIVARSPTPTGWLAGPAPIVMQLDGLVAQTTPTAQMPATRRLALQKEVASFRLAEVGVAGTLAIQFIHALGITEHNWAAEADKESLARRFQDAQTSRGVVYALGDTTTPTGGLLRILFQPSDPATADTLAEELRAWRDDLSSKLVDAEHIVPRNPRLTVRDLGYIKLLHNLGIRGLKEARIERRGDTVVFETARRILPEEVAIVDDMHRVVAERARRSATTIRTILDGTDPAVGLFENIEAPDFTEEVERARR